jgi:methyltransferase (TIGR00027 family)
MLCRKRYIDDVSTRAVAEGAESVVILGAGWDTRAHRLALPPEVCVFEVDLPALAERKRRRLTALSADVAALSTLVPIDFHAGNLAEVLAAHGYRAETRTVFVWEAVTQYLTETAVRATLESLRAAPAGSTLVFTYVRKDFLDGTRLYGAARLHQRLCGENALWRFGMHPEEVGGLLAGYGWREVEQMGPAQYQERYPALAERELIASELERSVHAHR